jgi:hypothetical protein
MEAPDRFMRALEGWTPYRIRSAAAVS